MQKFFNRRRFFALMLIVLTAAMLFSVGVFADGEEAAEAVNPFHATFFALIPPIVAIALALITKEVNSTLIKGI